MRFNRLFNTALLIVLTTIAFSSLVVAQQNRYSKRQVSDIIAKLEKSSNTFRRDFDKYLDQSSLNGTNEEDRVNRIVRNYETALDKLRRDFDVSDNWWQSRNNVRAVMDEARAVNAMMNNLSFARKLENQWRNMRRDVNSLADTYDLSGLSTDGKGDVPSWALGTWFARNPQNNGTIQMTINQTGAVTVEFGANTASFGRLNGTRLEIDGIDARIQRNGNDGLTTIRSDNGERIDYYRNNNGGNWNNNNNWGTGRPQKWAVGTWYARNPQTGGTITMVVNSNGQVTITMDNGSISYATLDDDRLNNNGITARVTRINDGIRTTRNDNGERIDYFRNNPNPNGNWNNNNNQMGDVPDWAVGTFYGRNPQNGGNITLTVQKNGSVTVNMDGQISYGTMYKTTFTLNGDTARVTKISNGFRMTNDRNGERIDYRRQ